jgi:hypothetical protein
MKVNTDALAKLASAIARLEGFGKFEAIPTLANNPGDLEWGNIGHGEIQAKTVFPTIDAGWNALKLQLTKMVDGRSHVYHGEMTLVEMGAIYSGHAKDYGKELASILSVDETTTLNQLLTLPDTIEVPKIPGATFRPEFGTSVKGNKS